MMNFIKDGREHWTVVINNQSYQFDPAHANYLPLVESVRSQDEQKFVELMSVGQKIHNWSDGNFRFTDGVLNYFDEEIHPVITDRIVDLIRNGFDYRNMLNFLVRLYQNPSYQSVQQLYGFMVHKNLPITPDGFILMYKAVSPTWMDKWTGKISNAIGQKPSMLRHRAVDDPDVACGPGLHAGPPQERVAEEYGGGYSMHVAAWPLLAQWPGDRFQTGLFGTWMHARPDEAGLPRRLQYVDSRGEPVLPAP